MTTIRSAYIHIPLCKQMCHYCNFVKYYYTEKRADEYLQALDREMDCYIEKDNTQLDTIYIGGGTPTALTNNQLVRLFESLHKKFDITHTSEFTIELNPGDIGEEKAMILRDYGVNRISFGVQVMDDEKLIALGRRHRVKDIYKTVDILTKYGFHNISLDLIYALPHQTVEEFKASLDEALAFQLPHYSTYALQIEPNTVFYKRHKRGLLHRPKEDDEVKMYDILKDSMAKHGVAQYEISNFAKPGFESKHNLAYWNDDYFYGFGAGASGYLPGERINNLRPLPAYVEQAMAGKKPIAEIDVIGIQEEIEEEMFLGFRKVKGYDSNIFMNKFGFPMEKLYGTKLKKLQKNGLVTNNGTLWKLTNEGMLLANRVFEEFILEETDLTELKSIN